MSAETALLIKPEVTTEHGHHRRPCTQYYKVAGTIILTARTKEKRKIHGKHRLQPVHLLGAGRRAPASGQ